MYHLENGVLDIIQFQITRSSMKKVSKLCLEQFCTSIDTIGKIQMRSFSLSAMLVKEKLTAGKKKMACRLDKARQRHGAWETLTGKR